ncbi:chemotaxis protein CheB [Polaromonas sp.]|uniref:chemotaxis protein CheB n=1 Tax=Polaromonas sp. TaxID=1869339 RepID=UPI0013BE11E8|nr:chemotaxis protein CheB [Polaromonas sp.]NDP63131.1 chemotaxis protein CheB [Polaromonas sp.]
MSPSPPEPVIVMGASAGGVSAILELAPALPRDFPAPILFVQHIGAHPSELWKLVSARGPNAAVAASDGDVPRPGTIHIAPPDQHMLLDGPVIRLSRGPKEHHARPAIDPLFRSAALDYGPRAIGVLLTGMLDDGSAGLRAIKDCGGTAVVQDPADAHAPSMPRSALACVDADHVVPLVALAPLLYKLASRPATRGDAIATPEPPYAPDALGREHAVSTGHKGMENLMAIASPTPFTCPECGGVLFELDDKRPVRLRCHNGHAFSLRSLAHLQEVASDAALCTSLRVLQEKQAVLRRLAQAQHAVSPKNAQDALREADAIADLCSAVRRLIKHVPGA